MQMTNPQSKRPEYKAVIEALIGWCGEHNVPPETVVAAAGFWLGFDTAKDALQDRLAAARQIFEDFVQTGALERKKIYED
jgi:hypothetical protein